MFCKECPRGKLIQVDSFIWMIQCPIEDVLMGLEEECCYEEKEINNK